MKKLSGIIAFILIASMLTTCAFADVYNIEDGSVVVSTEADGQYVSQGEKYGLDAAPVITGTSEDNYVEILMGESDANVTLKDLHINQEIGIYTMYYDDQPLEEYGDATINLEGSSSIKSDCNGIYSGVNTEIRSDEGAELKIDAASNGIFVSNWENDEGASLTIDNVKLDINQNVEEDDSSTISDGICVAGAEASSLNIKDSKINAYGESSAIEVYSERNDARISIQNSDINAKAEETFLLELGEEEEICFSGTGISATSESGSTAIDIENSKVKAEGDLGINEYANRKTSLTVKNSKVVVSGKSTGIGTGAANGTEISIQGSDVKVKAAQIYESQLDEDETAIFVGMGINAYSYDGDIAIDIEDSRVSVDAYYGVSVWTDGGEAGLTVKNSKLDVKSALLQEIEDEIYLGEAIVIQGGEAATIDIEKSRVSAEAGVGILTIAEGESAISIIGSEVKVKAVEKWSEKQNSELSAIMAISFAEDEAKVTLSDCKILSPAAAGIGSFQYMYEDYFCCGIVTKDADGNNIPCADVTIGQPGAAAIVVTDMDGNRIRYTESIKDGVLTVSTEEENAVLKLTRNLLMQLLTSGVDTLVFDIGGKQYTVKLSDLIAKLGDSAGSVVLTVEGGKATLMIAGNDYSDILS